MWARTSGAGWPGWRHVLRLMLGQEGAFPLGCQLHPLRRPAVAGACAAGRCTACALSLQGRWLRPHMLHGSAMPVCPWRGAGGCLPLTGLLRCCQCCLGRAAAWHWAAAGETPSRMALACRHVRTQTCVIDGSNSGVRCCVCHYSMSNACDNPLKLWPPKPTSFPTHCVFAVLFVRALRQSVMRARNS